LVSQRQQVRQLSRRSQTSTALQFEHEHSMGHYQTQTVYAALVKTYYWPHMREDILHCGPCIRHHLEPEINHSAQVINPIKIFDRFGADLVLGLPLTEEGYNGILLITLIT
jgi:hypothetical protein